MAFCKDSCTLSSFVVPITNSRAVSLVNTEEAGMSCVEDPPHLVNHLTSIIECTGLVTSTSILDNTLSYVPPHSPPESFGCDTSSLYLKGCM